jgi:hypothetical protein
MGFRNPVTTAIDPDARAAASTAQAAADAAAVQAALARSEIIPGTRIAADAIGANHISAGAITAAKLSATAIDGKTISGATLIGALVRALGSGDASATSTGHALQIGATSGLNLAVDGNEIVPRDNGALGQLLLTNARSKVPQEDLTNAFTRRDYVDGALGDSVAGTSWTTVTTRRYGGSATSCACAGAGAPRAWRSTRPTPSATSRPASAPPRTTTSGPA